MFINFGELDNFLPRLVATWFPLIKVILLNLSPRGHSPQQAGSSGRKVYVIEFWPMILVTIIAQIYNTVSVHCREEGCIGKYIPRGPRDFPRAGILHPEAREIARGRSPRAISRAEGCKIPARGKSRGPRGMYFPMHPDSRQCTSILSALAGKY